MKGKLVHPLWLHLPAAAAFLLLLGYLLAALPLPASAPVHFGPGGVPDRYGSPWETFGIFIALSLLFFVISFIIDELWARQEDGKRFNWLSLLDDVVLGAMSGFGLGYLAFLNSGSETFTFPASWFWPVFGGAIALAVVIEMLRPYRPYRQPLAAGETQGLREEAIRRSRETGTFVYWDYQNPVWVTLLSLVLPLVMFAGAAVSWMEAIWVSVLLAIVGLAMFLPYGGQRTLVTPDSVTVRWGLFGIPVLRLKTSEIAAVEIRDFSPLRDFGGYGIRFNREMKAYYLRGGRGVLFTLHNGKKYLVGSDKPADLEAVAEAVTIS